MKNYELIFDKYKAGKSLRLILERLPERAAKNLLSKITKNFQRLDADLWSLFQVIHVTGPKYLDFTIDYYMGRIYDAVWVAAEKNLDYPEDELNRVMNDILTHARNVVCAKVGIYRKLYNEFKYPIRKRKNKNLRSISS